MGDEKELNKREKDFSSWQVNKKMMSLAKKNCIFMHCLPAHRNKEVTSEVIDGLRVLYGTKLKIGYILRKL